MNTSSTSFMPSKGTIGKVTRSVDNRHYVYTSSGIQRLVGAPGPAVYLYQASLLKEMTKLQAHLLTHYQVVKKGKALGFLVGLLIGAGLTFILMGG